MKFCKKYEEYMQGQEKELPGVGFKKLKKILKKCRRDIRTQKEKELLSQETGSFHTSCPDHCPVCDGTFFPSLLKEMSAIVGFFNEQAQKLLELHLASGFRKYYVWFKEKIRGSHVALIEGGDLVNYAMINAIAIRKILKKYDKVKSYVKYRAADPFHCLLTPRLQSMPKVHESTQGQVFKSHAQSMHIEILQSPWLCELIAFHINLRETEAKSRKVPALLEGCSLIFNDGKPSLSCELFGSVKLDIDLTCSICLDTVFDAVALTCGHIFCYMCACSAASVTIVDGLKAADPKQKCPLCRQARVYESAVHLDELNILLHRNCHEYWRQRLQTERVARVRQAKEHWENHYRAFLGF